MSHIEDFERPITPKESKKYLVNFAGILIAFGCVILIIFICARMSVIGYKGEDPYKPDLSPAGTFGDFVGGFIGTIFNLAGALLLFYTLKEQRDNFNQERLESKLYEMIKIHRDNVAEMEFAYGPQKRQESTGRKVFKVIFDQFKDVWEEIELIFEGKAAQDIYIEDYLFAVQENVEVKSRGINPLTFARTDISYLIVFFGVAKDGQAAIKDIIADKYDSGFVDYVLQYAALKPQIESTYFERWKYVYSSNALNFFHNILEARKNGVSIKGIKVYPNAAFVAEDFFYPDDYEKYYGGHQFRLGHYYRHMFQVMNFIDDNFEDAEKRKEHMNFFRAQISIYEQYVYLLNSLSTLGRVAELETRKPPFIPQNASRHLISKYNIFRNIPNDEVVPGVRMKNFYPDIDYEAISNPGCNERRKQKGYD